MSKFRLGLRSFLAVSTVVFLVASSVIPAFAVDFPSFGSCPNPGGNIIANYDTGIHAIAGDPVTHSGSDYVYQSSETSVIQCFCPVDPGMGIQTNWLNAGGMTQHDIQSMQNSGWILIKNGADWGLTSDPYLAFNSNYQCQATPTPSATPSPTPEPVDLCKNLDGIQISVPDTYHQAGDNCLQWELGGAPTSSSTITGTGTGGQVLGASTSVLADTSSNNDFSRAVIATLTSIGIFFVLAR